MVSAYITVQAIALHQDVDPETMSAANFLPETGARAYFPYGVRENPDICDQASLLPK